MLEEFLASGVLGAEKGEKWDAENRVGKMKLRNANRKVFRSVRIPRC